jgi:hypothetical protein
MPLPMLESNVEIDADAAELSGRYGRVRHRPISAEASDIGARPMPHRYAIGDGINSDIHCPAIRLRDHRIQSSAVPFHKNIY